MVSVLSKTAGGRGGMFVPMFGDTGLGLLMYEGAAATSNGSAVHKSAKVRINVALGIEKLSQKSWTFTATLQLKELKISL